MGYRYEKRNLSQIGLDHRSWSPHLRHRPFQPPELADWLLARGRVAVTSADVAELLEIPVDQVRVRLNQQVRKQRFFTPARGLWIPIPPEYRTWGAVPATHFIDQLMQFLERDYYVGWLSAAELHGAAHQRPQVFQVAVSAALAQRDFGRVRLRFVTRSRVNELPRVEVQTPTGNVWVSTPELTASTSSICPG